ncbi:MAG: cell division protein FtsA [Caryophanon sp.]|nr:cell division protein FtsA [Caryophanon sp.]
MSQQKIYAALDIGSSAVKVLIGEVSNGQLHVIGDGYAQSSGVKKSAIVDIEATVQSIKRAVESAERMTNIKINDVILGIPANQIALQPAKGVVAVNSENKEITDEDLQRVMDSAQVMSIPPDRELVNLIPRQFIVDSLSEIQDPRGMMGVRLEVDATLITTSRTLGHNLMRCVERAGLNIREIVLQPLAGGQLALTDDELNQGTAYIDIGGGSTTVAFFENGILQQTAVIPVGGDHVTKDLSIILKTTTEAAEQIKYQYGHAYFEEASDTELFEVPVVGADSKDQYSQKYIAEIIGFRLAELFDMVLDELGRMGVQDLPGGIVLTGGMAKLEGIAQLARQVMQTRVRVYTPDYIGIRDPGYTTSVGLIHFMADQDAFFGEQAMTPIADPAEPYDGETWGQDPTDGEFDDDVDDKSNKKNKDVKSKVKSFFSKIFE